MILAHQIWTCCILAFSYWYVVLLLKQICLGRWLAYWERSTWKPTDYKNNSIKQVQAWKTWSCHRTCNKIFLSTFQSHKIFKKISEMQNGFCRSCLRAWGTKFSSNFSKMPSTKTLCLRIKIKILKRSFLKSNLCWSVRMIFLSSMAKSRITFIS